MAILPIPSAQDEKHLWPPYTGINFQYVTMDPVTKKPALIEETMIEETMSRRHPPKIFKVILGENTLLMTQAQVRYVIKCWLSVFVAQAEMIDERRLINPPDENQG